jgi:hypothetical protein
MMADAEPDLTHWLQKCRTRCHSIDQPQRGIFWTLALGRAPLIAVVENDGVLPPRNLRAQIHVNGTHAAEGRGGQSANFAATLEIDEDDFVPGGVVGQRNTAGKREKIAGSSRRIEPGELRARREIVERELIAPRDGGD